MNYLSGKKVFGVMLAAMLSVPHLSFAAPEDEGIFSIRGFGSVVAGTVTSGDGAIANYRDLGIYGRHGAAPAIGPDSQGSLRPESRVGAQVSAQFSPVFKATVQAIARGSQDFDPKINWAYLTWQANPATTVQVGRLGVPVYMYSDKMDIGFAYPWIRVPQDAYSIEMEHYHGARISHKYRAGVFNMESMLWAGTYGDDSPLMTYLFSTPIRRDNRFAGIVQDIYYGDTQVRFSYTKNKMKQSASNAANAFRNAEFDNRFIDVAIQHQFGDFTVIAEWNKNKPFYTSWLASGIYQFTEKLSGYVTRSKFVLDEPWEKHPTVSVGARYDLTGNMSLKADVTQMKDQGRNPFTGGANPVIKIAPGDSTLLSVGLDFVF